MDKDKELQMWANKLLDDYDQVDSDYSSVSEAFADFRLHLDKGYELVNFDEAPEWAEWWAMDRDGQSYWYSDKPVMDHSQQEWREWELEINCNIDKIMKKAPDFGLSPYYWVQSLTKRPPRIGKEKTTIKSDGGSTAYYDLPSHATELRHLISYKGMSKSRGDIFKACYRLGEKEGADVLYDLNKMKFFVDDLIEMNSRGEKL